MKHKTVQKKFKNNLNKFIKYYLYEKNIETIKRVRVRTRFAYVKFLRGSDYESLL